MGGQGGTGIGFEWGCYEVGGAICAFLPHPPSLPVGVIRMVAKRRERVGSVGHEEGQGGMLRNCRGGSRMWGVWGLGLCKVAKGSGCMEIVGGWGLRVMA